MILPAAFALGVASAVTYGVAAAVQHDAVQQAGRHGGRLRELLRDSRWWLSIGGDTLGVFLQYTALVLGPVVLIQPLFVLCLPVALPLQVRHGGPRPGRREYLDCVLLVAGLVGFFALVGDPSAARELTATTAGVLSVVAMAAGLVVVALARRLGSMAKAVTLSSITGVWFGVEAVLVNAVSAAWSHGGGIAALGRPTGLVALIGAIVVSLAGFTLGQFAFRAGNLAASFPSMLVVDPLIGVLLGVVLLHERLRSGVLVDLGYAVCAGVIVFATFRLARTTEQPAPRPAPA